MERSKLQIIDVQVPGEIYAFAGLIRVACRAKKYKPFISEGDSKLPDIGRNVSCPLLENIRNTSLAARLVRRFPYKDMC